MRLESVRRDAPSLGKAPSWRNRNLPGFFLLGGFCPGASLGPMLTPADARRRWVGLFCLALAFGMLVWGQTVLKDRLEGMSYLLFWGLCFGFTIAAVIVALIDMRTLRRRTREEHRHLLERTLEQVEKDSEKKKRKRPR